MSSFPRISELPKSIDTDGWDWQQVRRTGHPSDGFWLGTDKQGNRWLTKLRGSFYAYREILFGRLAQAMNWSCQSSLFIRIDRDSAKLLGCRAGDVHAAHWYMDEHVQPCCPGCVLDPLVDQEVHTIESLQRYEIKHLIDWPKSEFAAYIFGGNEPSGKFFTAAHEFVIIDSEQMFSTDPCSFDSASWLKKPDGSPSESGKALAIEVCTEIASLPSELVAQALILDSDLRIELRWPIAPKLRASIAFSSVSVAKMKFGRN
jgi:hypothetical protein